MQRSTSEQHTLAKWMGTAALGVLGLVVVVGSLVIYSMTRPRTTPSLEEM